MLISKSIVMFVLMFSCLSAFGGPKVSASASGGHSNDYDLACQEAKYKVRNRLEYKCSRLNTTLLEVTKMWGCSCTSDYYADCVVSAEGVCR